jgi:hypothetical protein
VIVAATDDNPRRHPDTAFRSVGDEGGLVVLPGKAEVKVLNPVAIKVFGLLDGHHSVVEIARLVTEEFEVEQGQALSDVRAFIDDLDRHGMLATEAPTRGQEA